MLILLRFLRKVLYHLSQICHVLPQRHLGCRFPRLFFRNTRFPPRGFFRNTRHVELKCRITKKARETRDRSRSGPDFPTEPAFQSGH